MINYSSMTVMEAVDELIIMAGEHRIAENFDIATLIRFIDRAYREIVNLTLPYKDWAYTTRMNVADGTVLPREFLRHIRVLVSPTGAPPYTEARYVDAREYYELTNWTKRQEWNKCTAQNPIFTIWGNKGRGGTMPTRLIILISPNTTGQTGAAPTGYTYDTDNVSGIMEYSTMPVPLTLETQNLNIPFEFQNLLIMSALSRILAETTDGNQLAEIQMAIQAEKQKAMELFFAKRINERKELDNFNEPVPPYVPPQPLPGELEGSV